MIKGFRKSVNRVKWLTDWDRNIEKTEEFMQEWIGTDSKNAKRTEDLSGTTLPRINLLLNSIENVVQGKPEAIKFALVALLGRGHLLIEDVPGIGKTTLANSLARSLALSFQRIQFTSDILPSDVVGISIFNQNEARFEWKPGPIFANIVLTDEINRGTPKTQSALLEAMAEEQVTFEGVSRELPHPFMVIATQNPTEHHGTYPLPESQLDRFMLRVQMGYPSIEDEKRILEMQTSDTPLDSVTPVMTREDVIELQNAAKQVSVKDSLLDYLLEITRLTRENEAIELGISPRGSLALLHSAQAMALIEGRDYCTPDDIKSLVVPCYAHRIMMRASRINLSRSQTESEAVLKEIVSTVEIPV